MTIPRKHRALSYGALAAPERTGVRHMVVVAAQPSGELVALADSTPDGCTTPASSPLDASAYRPMVRPENRALSSGALAPGAGTPHGAEFIRYEVTVQGHRITYFARKPPPMPSEPLVLVGYAGPADRVRTVRSEAEMRRLYGWR